MIAAIPLDKDNNEAKLYERFARAPYFGIINTEDKTVRYTANSHLLEYKGVGKLVLDELRNNYSVDSLIAYELGLKIQTQANEQGIRQIILHKEEQSVKDILELLHI